MTTDVYRDRFRRDILESRREVVAEDDASMADRSREVADRLLSALAKHASLLDARIEERRIVEGHRDLRAEHICLLDEPVVIDCLEFNRDFRMLDPADELSFLVLECARLRAPGLGEAILGIRAGLSGDEPAPLPHPCRPPGRTGADTACR